MTAPPRILRAALLVVALIGVAQMVVACTTMPPAGPPGSALSRTVHVPGDAPTIQAAVDNAHAGDLILVAAGTYREAVVVEKVDNITIRGTDRNRTILDGENSRDNGIKVFRNGVAVENLTIRDYKSNGVFFTGDFASNFVLTGYRASYVTTANNGEYGLYAFNATKGMFDHDYGSGHPDSAFYVGQCDPCDAVITDALAEHNMAGFTGTNASGVTIVRSEWRTNMIGIVPNSNDGEKLAPQKRITIAGNWVHDNTGVAAPVGDDLYHLVAGNGILVTGGQDDLITRNLVERNARGGIGIMMWPFRTGTLPPFAVSGNRVINNVTRDNSSAADSFGDLWLWTARASKGPEGNCFADNSYTTSAPAAIEAVAPCTGPADADVPGLDLAKLRPGPPGIDHRAVPAPPDQPQMPDAVSAPTAPASGSAFPPAIDLPGIGLPAGAPGVSGSSVTSGTTSAAGPTVSSTPP